MPKSFTGSDYPYTATARLGSPDTAFAAADSMLGIATIREVSALELVRLRAALGAPADEVADGLGWVERYSARPRLSMLRARGAIVDSGKRRKGVSGRMQAVWVVPQFAPLNQENTDVA